MNRSRRRQSALIFPSGIRKSQAAFFLATTCGGVSIALSDHGALDCRFSIFSISNCRLATGRPIGNRHLAVSALHNPQLGLALTLIPASAATNVITFDTPGELFRYFVPAGGTLSQSRSG